MKFTLTLALAALLLNFATSALAAGGKAITDAAAAGPDFATQGEYVGEKQAEGGKKTWGVQVIALGQGKFDAVGYQGGLPGAGYDGSEKKRASGQRDGDKVVFKIGDGQMTIQDGALTVTNSGGEQIGSLKKVERQSPTLGAKAPEGAVVLFDGTSVDQWEKGKLEDGLLTQGALSKFKHQDATVHIEFRLPYMPEARGQGRGNSGYYVQGRYEVQMLDSFGLDGKDNECGGIYSASAPKVNMCLPPLAWQTYDIDFTAAKFEGGKKVKNARITVRHNGVVIHDDLELPQGTPGGVGGESPEPGPLFVQDHGNPVRYRNIWVVERK